MINRPSNNLPPINVTPGHSPFFSIILPTFNRAHTLPRAVDSVLAQDFSDWELIVVDDESTDNTPKLVLKYTKQDSRVKYLQIKKSGVVLARTAGIKIADAPIITFLDSDDYYKPNHLSTNLAQLNATPPPDMIHSLTTVIGNPHVSDVHDLSRKLHIDECCAHGTFFIRRHVLKTVMPLPQTKYGEDYHLLQKILSAGYRVIKTSTRTYVYDRSGH